MQKEPSEITQRVPSLQLKPLNERMSAGELNRLRGQVLSLVCRLAYAIRLNLSVGNP
jgi:hypothetical protein